MIHCNIYSCVFNIKKSLIYFINSTHFEWLKPLHCNAQSVQILDSGLKCFPPNSCPHSVRCCGLCWAAHYCLFANTPDLALLLLFRESRERHCPSEGEQGWRGKPDEAKRGNWSDADKSVQQQCALRTKNVCQGWTEHVQSLERKNILGLARAGWDGENFYHNFFPRINQ